MVRIQVLVDIFFWLVVLALGVYAYIHRDACDRLREGGGMVYTRDQIRDLHKEYYKRSKGLNYQKDSAIFEGILWREFKPK